VTATDNHPFWVDSQRRWLEAKDLKPGYRFETADHRPAEVSSTYAWTEYQRVYNLTVDRLHTYYVVAGGTSILVHNGCIDYGSINKHGQRSGVRATLDSSNLGETTSPPKWKPPGWEEGDNRTHLLGAFIGGSNKVRSNYVAMGAEANAPVMFKFEQEVQKALKGNQTVDFRSTPIYDGTNPRPLGITLQATGSGPNPLSLDVTILNRKY
jgi:hypothetical protein